jgi:hypothetical protein
VGRDLVHHRYAIVSGEVWVVEGNLFCSLSPRKSGGWTVIAWDAPERVPGERWEEYAQRCYAAMLDAIYAMRPEESVAPEVVDKLYYHLMFADEHSYSVLRSRVA